MLFKFNCLIIILLDIEKITIYVFFVLLRIVLLQGWRIVWRTIIITINFMYFIPTFYGRYTPLFIIFKLFYSSIRGVDMISIYFTKRYITLKMIRHKFFCNTDFVSAIF